MLNVRLFCELLSFNLYSNGCVFEFVGGFLCILCECEASVLSKKKGLLQKRERRRRKSWRSQRSGLGRNGVERVRGQNTSVTQPTVFRKGNVGTSRVFTFWSLKHFIFFSFSSYLVWNYIRIVLVQNKKKKKSGKAYPRAQNCVCRKKQMSYNSCL